MKLIRSGFVYVDGSRVKVLGEVTVLDLGQ